MLGTRATSRGSRSLRSNFVPYLPSEGCSCIYTTLSYVASTSFDGLRSLRIIVFWVTSACICARPFRLPSPLESGMFIQKYPLTLLRVHLKLRSLHVPGRPLLSSEADFLRCVSRRMIWGWRDTTSFITSQRISVLPYSGTTTTQPDRFQ